LQNFRSKEKGAVPRWRPRPAKHAHELVAIVIVVIPIAIGMPAVAVFVPPAMAFVPAAFPRFAQFMPRVIRLPAGPAVMIDGLVQPMICLGDAALALVIAISIHARGSGKGQQSKQGNRRQQDSPENPLLSRLKAHSHFILHV